MLHLIESWICSKKEVQILCLPVLNGRQMLIYAAILALCFCYHRGAGSGLPAQGGEPSTILHV